jgi:glycosyltransferase involved in cell wall biosynthesis
MQLLIVHYHLRPGGIRRILELATPQLVRDAELDIHSVVVASGEAADRRWREDFASLLAPTPLRFFIEPAFNYFSEQRSPPARLAGRIRRRLAALLREATGAATLVWAHNLAIGRNLLLSRELVRACEERCIPLLAHHHDWWFDNRWLRWPEFRRCGVRTLDAAAGIVLPTSRCVRHVAINHADAAILRRHFRAQATWLPNLTEPAPLPPRAQARAARAWLKEKLGDGDAPVWLLPCRLLRRKNIAEALLLTRWLRPAAWLVTTGGVSSADEQAYFAKLDATARRHHWRLRLGVLAGDEARKPSVADLLAASEAVLLTSIQEGFGLPYLEAAVAGRPLIARALPNISPDLSRFGFTFPQLYREVWVDPQLFDWRAELKRQRELFQAWRRHLPRRCRAWVGTPVLREDKATRRSVPFSRLTLTAQLEVLAHPARDSWELCAPLNPLLDDWRRRASRGRLRATVWPRSAGGWLSGQAYAARLRQAVRTRAVPHLPSSASAAAQRGFIRAKLEARYLYPLLWGCES